MRPTTGGRGAVETDASFHWTQRFDGGPLRSWARDRDPRPLVPSGIGAILIAMVLLAVNTSPAELVRTAAPASLRPFDQTAPTVLAERGFSIEQAVSGTSAGFPSNPGDAIVVWATIFGRDSVAGVTDSAGDSFQSISTASMAFGTNGAYNGLSVWIATHATGGSSVGVTVTLHPPFPNSLNDSAVVVVDVTGVA